jgi:hypothetical protein
MKKIALHPYSIASVWAAALTASSYWGRGWAAGPWIDAMLYVAAGTWVATSRQLWGAR